ncbi:PDR/VanB family oxidoreductase [Telluria aromaticivorans]|uniref:Oxidoreductase n=1 Tax=Telluria aromaticivorans TaxID=2725995 RepID=A0A7Y2JUZ3_9BURK|nr:PDR/VanB family oxidoreductase [Telluria aromaticivorans]NNG21472.1 oxidoreductase [Telluria aromaticivorans]
MCYLIQTIIQHGPAVKEFRLVPADGSRAPAWQPGAHVELDIQSRSGARYRHAYSLVGVPSGQLRIAVQREVSGKGGSRVLHDEYQAGMGIDLSEPLNSFHMHVGTARNVLIAGGIGITPMVSMALAMDAAGAGFELHYVARDAGRLILLDDLAAVAGGSVATYVTNSAGRPDLHEMIGAYSEGSELHACGPAPLLEAIRQATAEQGWPMAHVHFESFGARSAAEDRPVRLYLRQSDQRIDVAPGTSLLDAMIAADAFVAYYCKRGECGNCFANVVKGQPLHRDVCLTTEQRSQGITTCVSWTIGGELELDL